jgi:hypothetical protein
MWPGWKQWITKRLLSLQLVLGGWIDIHPEGWRLGCFLFPIPYSLVPIPLIPDPCFTGPCFTGPCFVVFYWQLVAERPRL